MRLTSMPAIAEHQRQYDNIKFLQAHYTTVQNENDMLRRELQQLRLENSQLRSDGMAGRPAPAQTLTDSFTADQYGRQPPRPELPPLRSLSGPITTAPPAPESMTGVQYEQPRVNGYRPSERF